MYLEHTKHIRRLKISCSKFGKFVYGFNDENFECELMLHLLHTGFFSLFNKCLRKKSIRHSYTNIQRVLKV